MKNLSSKSAGTSNYGNIINKFIVLNHEGDIACIEVQDRQFIIADNFSKEDSYIYVENLTFLNTSVIKKSDLSFTLFEDPNKVDKKNLKDQHYFCYDSYRMTCKSAYKSTSAQSNDQTN